MSDIDLNAIEQRIEKQGVVTFDDIEAVIEYARELEGALKKSVELYELAVLFGHHAGRSDVDLPEARRECLELLGSMIAPIYNADFGNENFGADIAFEAYRATTTADNRARGDAAGECTEQTA